MQIPYYMITTKLDIVVAAVGRFLPERRRKLTSIADGRTVKYFQPNKLRFSWRPIQHCLRAPSTEAFYAI